MNKKTIITILLALVTMTGQAQTKNYTIRGNLSEVAKATAKQGVSFDSVTIMNIATNEVISKQTIQDGSDLGLMDGLSPDIEKSDVYDRTLHPCRLDFERFAERIGLPKKRAASVLDMFMEIPQKTYALIDHSFLNDKMKRTYKRVIEERKTRFIRQSVITDFTHHHNEGMGAKNLTPFYI